jgi:hypothetical protein
MIAGANTPAMIKTMTTEVESRNLIAASIHPCADRFHTGMPPRPRVLALPRADVVSHYTLDTLSGNAHHHEVASAIRKKRAPADTKPAGTLFPTIHSRLRAARDVLRCFVQLSQALHNFSFRLAFRGDWRETLTRRPASGRAGRRG